MTKDDEARHHYLTGNVITQEFTNCSIKAVRLADRIIEWFNGQTFSLKAEVESLQSQLAKAEEDKKELLSALKEMIGNSTITPRNVTQYKTAFYLINKHG